MSGATSVKGGWLRRGVGWLLVLNLISFYIFFFVGLVTTFDGGIKKCYEQYEPYITLCGRLPVGESEFGLWRLPKPIYISLIVVYIAALPIWPGLHYGLYSGHEVAYMVFAWRYMLAEDYCLSPMGCQR